MARQIASVSQFLSIYLRSIFDYIYSCLVPKLYTNGLDQDTVEFFFKYQLVKSMGCLASLSLRYRHFPTPTGFWDRQKITAHFNLPNQWPWLTNEVSSRRYTSFTVDVALFEVLPACRIWIGSLIFPQIALITTSWNKSELPPPPRPFLQYVLKSPEDGAKTWLSCS